MCDSFSVVKLKLTSFDLTKNCERSLAHRKYFFFKLPSCCCMVYEEFGTVYNPRKPQKKS